MRYFHIVNTIKQLSCVLWLALITRRAAGGQHSAPGKAWAGFEYIPQYDRRPHSQPLATSDRSFGGRRYRDRDAEDLYREYKHSIYVSRWYNASFVCQIPFFTLTLPQRNNMGSVAAANAGQNIAYPFIHALFALAGVALFSPLIFPEHRRRSTATSGLLSAVPDVESINRFLDRQMRLMSDSPAIGRQMRSAERRSMFYFLGQHLRVAFESVLNTIDHWTDRLPPYPRHKLQHCFRLSVCRMYSRPEKYRVVGLLFRSVFPYDRDLDNSESSVMSGYRTAAAFGRNRTNDCFRRYDSCSVSVWDVLREGSVFLVNRSADKLSATQRKVLLFAVNHVLSYFE
ncbi:unnamed protein product [Medioppia subpectinata]|uniref:Uncharacterized protein n=1 Tax=Medioppia subpectinata TaxID=1979941 RepID=A0A7R9Q2L9_9ACAR|nr:unnamed protein product [Medioppia subpectinata]CAG2110521.1 unnamed protein product [Medioppia subpectinata]